MDDPSEEYWEIEGYSQSYESNDKLRWIWKEWLCLGKKIMVTSIVISSAPIILPPLVVMSAFGVACLLPAGFAFVTYVCAEKLFNCLLRIPSSPPLLGEGTMSCNEEGYRVVDDVQKGYGENVDIQAEEKEFEEDTRKGVEMRVELEEVDNEIDDYDEITINTDRGDRRVQGNEIVEEEGYVEDDGEYMVNKEQPLNSNVIPDILEGIREAKEQISMIKSDRDEMPLDSLQALILEAELGGEDESNVERVLEEMAILEPHNEKEENGHAETFTGINEEEMRRETTATIVEMRDEGKGNQKSQENEVKGDIPMKDMPESSGNRDLFVIPEEVKPDENVGVLNAPAIDDTSNYASIQQVHERKPEEDESVSSQAEPNAVVQKRLVVHVQTVGDNTGTDVHQGNDSDNKRRQLIFSNADAREMADESGFDLFDHDTMGLDQSTMSVDMSSAEEEPFSDDIVDVNVDYHEVLIVSKVSKPKGAETAQDQDTKAGSDKKSASEKKIWEQIQAMRTIVGYKETPHPSCVEELKALYLFTGVEPPASFENPTDIADISEKLHFLMAIVGVK